MSIQLKRSLTSAIDSSYVLDQGQVGIEMPGSSNTSSAPFKMKIGDGTTAWSSLPYVHAGTSDSATTATSASKLTTARTIRTNLGSTATASFDGQSNITPGVTGTLPVARGGTGVTTLDALKTSLGISSGGSGDTGITKQTYGYIWSATDTPYNGFRCAFHLVNYLSDIGLYYSYDGEPDKPIVKFDQATLMPGYDNAVSLGRSLSAGGNVNYRWMYVASVQGVVQSSDKRDKFHISYLSDANATQIDDTSPTQYNPDLTTVIDFVNNCSPATFVYKSAENDSDTSNIAPSQIQLGLIADDLENHPLFPYIGTSSTADDGEIHRGLQPLPLAVAALTACKYLLSRVEMLEDRLIG